MEDRFQHKLFFACMFSLVLSLASLGFALYILPYLIWEGNYDIPDFILNWIEQLKENYSLTEKSAKTWVFLTFFSTGLIAGFVSYIMSNKIENKVLGIVTDKPEEKQSNEDIKETFSFVLKTILMIVLALAAVFFVQWLLTEPTIE